jgi:hypothetical protein
VKEGPGGARSPQTSPDHGHAPGLAQPFIDAIVADPQDKPEVAGRRRVMPATRVSAAGGERSPLGTARTGAGREWRVLEALDPSNVGLPSTGAGTGTSSSPARIPSGSSTSLRRKKEANDGDTQWQR